MADAVVVGAGSNGLVAATLADAGWSVVVCEATPHPGGAVRTAEVTAPDYRTDLFSAFYPLSVASPILSALQLENYGLVWSHAPAAPAHVLPDDRCAVLHRDRDRTAESLAAFHPDDGAAWLRLVEEWDRIAQPLIDAVFRPFLLIMPTQRLLRSLGVHGSMRFARMAYSQPVRRLGEETFRGVGGPVLLAGNALHADLAPDGAGERALWLVAVHDRPELWLSGPGWRRRATGGRAGRPAPGPGRRRPRRRSGDPILLTDGRASGVLGLLAPGSSWNHGRAVIAGCFRAPSSTSDLGGADRLPPRLVADLRNFQWDAPTFKVNWALSRPLPWLAEGARTAGTVHLGVDLDGLTDYAADLATRRIPSRPFLLLGQMTTSDPTRSPAGTESAWAYTHLPAGIDLRMLRSKPTSSLWSKRSSGTRRDSTDHRWPVRAAPRRSAGRQPQPRLGRYQLAVPPSYTSSSSFARCQGWRSGHVDYRRYLGSSCPS